MILHLGDRVVYPKYSSKELTVTESLPNDVVRLSMDCGTKGVLMSLYHLDNIVMVKPSPASTYSELFL
jgi:hypothetical protein